MSVVVCRPILKVNFSIWMSSHRFSSSLNTLMTKLLFVVPVKGPTSTPCADQSCQPFSVIVVSLLRGTTAANPWSGVCEPVFGVIPRELFSVLNGWLLVSCLDPSQAVHPQPIGTALYRVKLAAPVVPVAGRSL